MDAVKVVNMLNRLPGMNRRERRRRKFGNHGGPGADRPGFAMENQRGLQASIEQKEVTT